MTNIHKFNLQKQYMFVYRAIMEMAQFGDTEIESVDIKKTWMALTHEEKNKKCPKLEQEFAKLTNIVDDRKALSVGKCVNSTVFTFSLDFCISTVN